VGPHYGSVTLGNYPSGSSGLAYFGEQAPDATRSFRFMGSCLETIRRSSMSDPLVAAGTISVSSREGAKTLSKIQGTEIALLSGESTTFWQTGDTITIDFSGGPVSTYTTTVTMPEGLTATLPPSDVPIDRTRDLVVPFTSASASTDPVWLGVTELVDQGASGFQDISVQCHSNPGQSAISVPHQLLQNFIRQSDSLTPTSIRISVARWKERVERVAGWDLLVEAGFSTSAIYDIGP